MADPAVEFIDDEVRIRRAQVRFPVEIRVQGVVAEDPATWPLVEGRLESVEGRLLYMPPCADTQQYVASDVTFLLRSWAATNRDYVVGSNEAGMKLGQSVRAADAAVWRRDDVGNASGRVQTVPPVLAVEVAGTDEEESVLVDKARWYLDNGVTVVWLVLPDTREVVAMTKDHSRRYSVSDRLDESPNLPGLSPRVDEFFAQL
jgi:Uma2 family endonuclease